MKIYTRRGDSGSTSSFTGERIKKCDPRIDAVGTVDELNSLIWLVHSSIIYETDTASREIKAILESLQHDLFTVGAEITMMSDKDTSNFNTPKLTEKHILDVENAIDTIQNKLAEQKSFLLPGGTHLSAWLHFSRTVCRRAERDLVRLHDQAEVKYELLKYLNRLSDLLYVLARYANKELA